MQWRDFFLISILAAVVGAYLANAAIVGTATIKAPAVILTNNTGSITIINVTVTSPGIGNIVVLGPRSVGLNTQQSAQTAAQYAAAYLNISLSNYNFTYYIASPGGNVSGPSAGAAMTLLAISAISHRPLRNDFTITGTIGSDGSIGPIGGVYDKVGAATQNSLKLVLVPRVPTGSIQNLLYVAAQANYGIPVVQVSNISNAAYFAFNGKISGGNNMTSFPFYTNYRINNIPPSNMTCSNQCNTAVFNALVNATLNFTNSQISILSASASFNNVTAQLRQSVAQDTAIMQKGYYYTAANFAFLNYINAYYLNSRSISSGSALVTINNVKNLCQALVPPPLTTSNYDYVIGAELRQTWGNYTISSVLSGFNVSAINTDTLLNSMYSTAQASGWCRAAAFVYGAENDTSNTPLVASQALQGIALNRINRAAQTSPGIYLTTAQQAYKQANYPLAIFDADYAFAIANASTKFSGLSTTQLDSLAVALAKNSTYGAWATEFSKQAIFYAYQSQLAGNNATLAQGYATSAYSAALLAQQISTDTKVIGQNLVPISGPLGSQSVQLPNLVNYISGITKLIYSVLTLAIIVLVINIVLLAVILKRMHRHTNELKMHAEALSGLRKRRGKK